METFEIVITILICIYFIGILPAAYLVGKYDSKQVYCDNQVGIVGPVLWPIMLVAVCIFYMFKPIIYIYEKGMNRNG